MTFRWNAIAPWAAPALLLVIALAQFSFSHFSSLSPWKGGGFGMFSTVDSPAARFLRVYLVTDQGEVAVFLPDRLREAARELRTTGSEPVAAKLARSIAQGTWVKLRMASAGQYYRQLSQTPAAPGQPGAADLADDPVELHRLNLVRMLRTNEPVGRGDRALNVESVRVEVWKYTFDRNQMSLNAKKLLEVVAPAGAAAKAAL